MFSESGEAGTSIFGEGDFVVLRKGPFHLSANFFVVVDDEEFWFHGGKLQNERRLGLSL